MSVRFFIRIGAVLGLLAVLSGCAWFSSGSSSTTSVRPFSSPKRHNPCQANPADCMYKGNYEQGEALYAEQEAARLNRAEAARIQRGLF